MLYFKVQHQVHLSDYDHGSREVGQVKHLALIQPTILLAAFLVLGNPFHLSYNQLAVLTVV